MSPPILEDQQFLRILMICDVIGKLNRDPLQVLLVDFKREQSIDFVACNGTNTVGGFGITAYKVPELIENGVGVQTFDNHISGRKEISA